MYKYDPTKTLTLRQEFVQQFRARFMAIISVVRTSIITNDCLGLKEPISTPLAAQEQPPTDWTRDLYPLPNEALRFKTNPLKIQGFMDWLQEMEEKALFQVVRSTTLGEGLSHQWSDIYISRAYQKGIIWGSLEIKKNKDLMDDLGLTMDEIPTSSESAIRAFKTQIHADRVGILYTRVFTDLKGITAALDAAVSRVLAEGMSLGWNPIKTAREITKRIKTIGIHRATILARTETIRAHHIAAIQTYRSYGVVGVKVQAEWATARDSRVCSLCQPLDGKIYTLDKIEPLIPLHPQCRCAALPVVVEND